MAASTSHAAPPSVAVNEKKVPLQNGDGLEQREFEQRYERLPLTAAGLYQSAVLPGLWLNPAALVAGDLLAVTQTVQHSLASREHAAFVRQLQQAAATRQS